MVSICRVFSYVTELSLFLISFKIFFFFFPLAFLVQKRICIYFRVKCLVLGTFLHSPDSCKFKLQITSFSFTYPGILSVDQIVSKMLFHNCDFQMLHVWLSLETFFPVTGLLVALYFRHCLCNGEPILETSLIAFSESLYFVVRPNIFPILSIFFHNVSPVSTPIF